MKWFRLYDGILCDPKIQLLPVDLRWKWIECLCIANQNSERGTLPALEHVAFHFKASQEETCQILEQLINTGLVDRCKGSKKLRMHNWDERQRKSDDIAVRVASYRKQDCNVTRNVTDKQRVTLPSRVRATDTEQSRTEQSRDPLPPSPENAFEPTKPIPPEVIATAKKAEEVFSNPAFAMWVHRQYLSGETIEDIRTALDSTINAGKSSLRYAGGALRGIHQERAENNGRP